MVNVLIVGIDEDCWVSDRVLLRLVDPWVQGRDVNVLDLFADSSLGHVMQFDSVRASTEEGVSGLERFDEFQGVEELTEIRVGFHFLIPVALPHDFHVTATLSQGVLFHESGFVDFLEGAVVVTDGKPVAVLGKAAKTAVP